MMMMMISMDLKVWGGGSMHYQSSKKWGSGLLIEVAATSHVYCLEAKA